MANSDYIEDLVNELHEILGSTGEGAFANNGSLARPVLQIDPYAAGGANALGASVPRSLPLSHGTPEPSDMSLNEYIASGKAGGLSDAYIAKELEKNPGASIFDVAKTHVGGTSQKYTPSDAYDLEIAPAGTLNSLPRTYGVPSLPLAARVMGTSENLLHGTNMPWARWQLPEGAKPLEEDALKLPDDELGVHFGNSLQASGFAGTASGGAGQRAPRVYPVVVSTQNPLELRDTGTWHLDDIDNALREINKGEHFGISKLTFNPDGSVTGGDRVQISPQLKGFFPSSELSQIETMPQMRDYLATKGFDSIKYVNKAEDPGNYSYIKFTPSPVAPDFVMGVRSPFAAFDPAKLAWPELHSENEQTLTPLTGVG